MMTEQEALENLTQRGCSENLFITFENKQGPLSGPIIVTYINSNGVEDLQEISKALGGYVRTLSGKRVTTWMAGQNLAVEIIEKLIPVLLRAKNKQAIRRAGYARNTLLEWRRARRA